MLAVALCLVFGFAFSWPFIYMGLVAGNAQAANGMAFLAFPLVFVSSAYVPVESMPGWLQPVAENQPVTMMVGAVRSLALGDDASELFPHSAGWYTVGPLAWSVVDGRDLRPDRHPQVRQGLSAVRTPEVRHPRSPASGVRHPCGLPHRGVGLRRVSRVGRPRTTRVSVSATPASAFIASSSRSRSAVPEHWMRSE